MSKNSNPLFSLSFTVSVAQPRRRARSRERIEIFRGRVELSGGAAISEVAPELSSTHYKRPILKVTHNLLLAAHTSEDSRGPHLEVKNGKWLLYLDSAFRN